MLEIDVFVEIDRGSRHTYEVDKVTGRLRLERVLHSSYHYLTNYGFMPNTLAGDGDALDVFIIVHEPTFPGCRVCGRCVGGVAYGR